jgi:hypothetical protein
MSKDQGGEAIMSNYLKNSISRRKFVKLAAATTGFMVLPPVAGAGKAQVEYVRKNIPAISVPPYRGITYADRVPDTLDLAERAELAINALTRIPDPNADYECFFTLQINRNPMVMAHEWSTYVGQQAKFMEALTMLRTVTGNKSGFEEEQGMMRAAAHMLGEDGLYYQPVRGRAWALVNSTDQPIPGATDPDLLRTGQFSDSYCCGRMLLAMSLWYQRDKNPFWRDTSERMIKRFGELSKSEGDAAHFVKPFVGSGGYLTPGGKLDSGTSTEGLCMFTHNGPIQGMVRYYKLTGFKPALELAGQLSRWEKKCAFDKDGQAPGQHFHGHTMDLIAMLEYAVAAHDGEMIEFVRKSYEWFRTIGSATVGWFPEMARADYLTAESCEIAEMVVLAVLISELGVGDYWEDAERYLRNQFAENQLSDGAWMQRISEASPKAAVGYRESADDAVRRNIGGFAGWSLANDFVPEPKGPLPRGFAFMHCCTGNSSRAIYYAWRSIVGFEDKRLRLNLLLNRASRWADVHSFLPYEGRVELAIKRPCSIEVRIPSWVDKSEVRAHVGTQERSVRWNGQYASIGDCKTDERASITFPLSEHVRKETIGGAEYTLTLKGYDVVAIDPPGRYCPYYQRNRYRTGPIEWKSVPRFLSDENLLI